MHYDKSLSDNITFTVIDDENRYFEYHIDDDRIFIFNRFDTDEGEEIFGNKADEIRKFAKNELAKLTQKREIKPGSCNTGNRNTGNRNFSGRVTTD